MTASTIRCSKVTRPSWARWLDTLAVPAARLVGRLVQRPSDDQLHRLAGRTPIHRSDSPALCAADHIQSGRAAIEANAFGEALHHFGQAIQVHPQARWAWHGRGDALQLSGDHAQARAAYERAISLDPSCGLHHAGRANALEATGKSTDAQAAWADALRLDPSLSWMKKS